jgi:hypothetical protein
VLVQRERERGVSVSEYSASRPDARVGLTAAAHRKRRILNTRCAAYCSGMTRRGSGRFRCSAGAWLAGLRRFNFRVARDPDGALHIGEMATARSCECTAREDIVNLIDLS